MTSDAAKYFFFTNRRIAIVPSGGGTPRVLPTSFNEDPALAGSPMAAISSRNFDTARREVVQWKSSDGTTVEGILVKPADFDPKKKYPLLVVIHSCPTGIDVPSIAADRYYPVERFVAENALVLRPNDRGSAAIERSSALPMCAMCGRLRGCNLGRGLTHRTRMCG